MSAQDLAAAQLIYGPNVAKTQLSMANIKFLSCVFTGAVAGILGLENWLGFGLFLFSAALWTTCLYVVNCKGRPGKFVQGGLVQLAQPSQDDVATFILVWTLFYGKSSSFDLINLTHICLIGVVHGTSTPRKS